MDCAGCRMLFTDFREKVLAQDLARAAALHLEGCPGCAAELKLDAGLDRLVGNMKTVEPGPGPVLAVKALYMPSGKQRRTDFGPVLDIGELAEYLRMSREDIEENLDQIPSFEFAGNVRFRKESIEQWIIKKESDFGMQKLGAEIDRILSSGIGKEETHGYRQ